MKLSLNWIFDHIQDNWHHHDIPQLVERFNAHVVEIEHTEYITIDLTQFVLCSIKEIHSNALTALIPEYNREVTLPTRPDAKQGNLFLLKKQKNEWRWAQGPDFKSSKEGLLPRLSVPKEHIKGSWKDNFQSEDHRLTIDNVAISHRPDLWGHRGFAREFAALLNTSLVPVYDLTAVVPVKEFEYKASQTPESHFSLAIEDRQDCRRLAGLYIPSIEPEGSWLDMAYRLLLVDARPINAIVDATNYVMFDLSQPLHAFDAHKLEDKQLIARKAKKGQSLELLDDQVIELTKDNLIIGDGKKPLALAGIMGGKACSVNDSTSALLVESASFEPNSVRASSDYFKVRSEASTRFEKNLDPNQNVTGLTRFIRILSEKAQSFEKPEVILSLGYPMQPHVLEVTNEYLEKKLGITLESSFIDSALTRLGFGVELISDTPKTYRFVVPTFRGTKDVLNKEDIAEEVGRCYGFGNIPYTVPSLKLKPHSIRPVFRLDQVRHYLAFAASMHEVKNYPLYDKHWLEKIDYIPEHPASVINPVAEHMSMLVTSLVPHLLKNVDENSAHINAVNFFEVNAIWHKEHKSLQEKQSLTGIFYQEKRPVDFYEKKCELFTLFKELGLTVSSKKPSKKELAPWYHPYKTMALYIDKEHLGFAGICHPALLDRVLAGEAFIFEFDANLLLQTPGKEYAFHPLNKFERTWADVSMLIPVTIQYQTIKDALEQLDDRIFSVQLIDHFQKEDWKDQRSIAIRYLAQASDHTLTGDEIEQLHTKVTKYLQKKFGAQIR